MFILLCCCIEPIECEQLLKRFLVINPLKRASLTDVMKEVWHAVLCCAVLFCAALWTHVRTIPTNRFSALDEPRM